MSISASGSVESGCGVVGRIEEKVGGIGPWYFLRSDTWKVYMDGA